MKIHEGPAKMRTIWSNKYANAALHPITLKRVLRPRLTSHVSWTYLNHMA